MDQDKFLNPVPVVTETIKILNAVDIHGTELWFSHSHVIHGTCAERAQLRQINLVTYVELLTLVSLGNPMNYTLL